ncbi:hypothetical protein GSI_08994 [Ganoderma sinense ZZ0214-1]|uniref:Uncharacterized protein n=1 Tax=Ganoderma sinense ZZ0214-1 TaxID=1077348 RepID=A0A2G8S5D3_9APHY|nr:hypothetical protein GSI_08994 [Ganoderma sinense ZZ0214-1]
MMSRVLVFFFAVLAFASSLVFAAPVAEIAARQIGDIQCNVDRLSIVGDLAGLQKTLKTLSTQTANDATASAGVQSVTSSISGAQSAIGTIAKALLTGQTAPADARDQVKSNLLAAQSTLAGITSTDSAVTANLQKATTQLQNAETAGEGVVANC